MREIRDTRKLIVEECIAKMVTENDLAAPRAKLTGNEDENEEDFLFYKGKGEYGRRGEDDDDDDDDDEEDGEYEEEGEGDAEEEIKGGQGARAKTTLVENSVLNGAKNVQEENGGSIRITDEISGTSSRNYPSLSVSEKSNSYSDSSGSYPAFSVSEKDFSIQDEDSNIPAPPKNFLVGDSKLLTPEKEKNASTKTDKANGPSLSKPISFRSPENVKGIDFDDDYDDTSDFKNKSLIEKDNILENKKTEIDEKSEEEKTMKGEGIGEVAFVIFEKTEKNVKSEKEEKNVKATLTESISLRVRPVESVEGVRFDDEIVEEEDEDEGEGEEEEETAGGEGSKRTQYLEQTGERGIYQDSLNSDVTGLDFSTPSQTELEEDEDLRNGKKSDELTNLELRIKEQSSLYEHGLRVRQTSSEIADNGEFGKKITNEKDVDVAIAKELQISETKNNSSTDETSIQPKTSPEVPTSENSHKLVSKVILQEQSSISESVTIPNSHEKHNMTEVKETPVPVPLSDSVPVPAPASVPVSVTAPVSFSVPVPVTAPVSVSVPVPVPVAVLAPVSVSTEALDLSPLEKPDSSTLMATETPIQGDLKSTLIPVASKEGGKKKLIGEDDDENYGVKQKGFRRILGDFVCGSHHRNV